jgi:hypothetical protein
MIVRYCSPVRGLFLAGYALDAGEGEANLVGTGVANRPAWGEEGD